MNEQKTFAEWLTDFILTHPGITITTTQGPYGCLDITMTIETPSGLKKKVGYLSTIDIYMQTGLDLDDELIRICETLRKELNIYGNQSERSPL